MRDSHSTASVAGVPIAARPSSSSGGTKEALVTVLLPLCAVGGVGGFLLLGNDVETAPVQAVGGKDEGDDMDIEEN